ncbi:hypothetical protein HN51_049985 [Arachis hypogaea]|uniref:Nematode resistance protein-like HSPRO2 n=1 Tax=Arachis hypogaea TaxID=3818 RepID=A0A444YD78_ARAHY|nr:nematode resistance protein-like HSPRO2 [Arachis ipaensis]XP_025667602.1 nematode resistance protein-like HSPRO2 [Arachis hypogaea]QHN91627.1 Nematode resistance protein-like [Arachis hypogaea]RYQ99885.1 hypothetical protein Ahy_B07g087897 [Arachis hypogaea]
MVDLEWKSKMARSKINVHDPKSPKLAVSDKPVLQPNLPALQLPLTPNDIKTASFPLCEAYDNYLRLPQLRTLWDSNNFPRWAHEPIMKPALNGLEITFRFISTVLSDPRPYANKREWARRLESLAKAQVQLISTLCKDQEESPETCGEVPVRDVSSSGYRSYSEASLLPRLATWHRSKDVAQRILATVEAEMTRCSYTLGLGEPNLTGKPILRYDAVCMPNELHSLETTPFDHVENFENLNLHATHQIVESWSRAARVLLESVAESVEGRRFEKAARECYAVERIWKLLSEIEDLHLLMDPNDFMKLKKQIAIRGFGDTAAFCFRSKELVEVAKICREMKRMVPGILEVEVDPKGGPGMVEAAMRIYAEKKAEGVVEVLQAMLGIEAAMKRFFYDYKQVVAAVMGSAEAGGNRVDSGDSLSQIFLEPTYFPSLDAAKTFLGYYWDNHENTLTWH